MSFAEYKEYGFRNIQFRGAGRVPGLWMTMVWRATNSQHDLMLSEITPLILAFNETPNIRRMLENLP